MTAKAAVRGKRTSAGVRVNPSRLASVLFLVFLIYLLVLVGGQFARLHALERGVMQAKEELETVKAHNEQLWERVRLLQSDAYVESLAREDLGLVKPGEVPVVVTVEPAEEKKAGMEAGDQGSEE